MMQVHEITLMAMKSYGSQAEVLVKNYLLSDPFIPYTSIICGIFLCKMAYDFTHLISSFYFKSYAGLNKIQRIEWNNRGISTLHAIFITVTALYLVFFSDLFSDNRLAGLVTFRRSTLSTFALGVSVGYFIADIGMIMWMYPSLGGIEYIVHHFLSVISVAYSLFTGEGQLYTYMVLISETTTPGINLRWYLDAAGMKRSNAYVMNGIVMFFTWLSSDLVLEKKYVYGAAVLVLKWASVVSCSMAVLNNSLKPTNYAIEALWLKIISRDQTFAFLLGYVIQIARVLLFVYLFYHVYLHYNQVEQLHPFGYLLVFGVPAVLAIMNLIWFMKIVKGLKKQLAKRQ